VFATTVLAVADSAGVRVSPPSYTVLESCGTINVTGSGSGDQAPIYARGATDIEVPYLTLTGAPLYGIFMRNVNNLILGQIDLRLSSGLGIRIDNLGDTSGYARNIRIDNVYVSGTGTHGVETYGVDGITVGTVTARNVHDSGLLRLLGVAVLVARLLRVPGGSYPGGYCGWP
jgi:hypothetical protein